MLRILLITSLVGLALSEKQDFSLCFKGSEEIGDTCMSVQANGETSTIYYHVTESSDYEDVKTLEDYNVGLAASRVASQEACYVRRLVKSYSATVDYLVANNNRPAVKAEAEAKVAAVPCENPEEEIGSELTNFCGDLSVYKLMKPEKEERQVDNVEKRQININFTRCVLLLFIPVCYTTTLTLPTGLTVTFGWFFFG
ncbi:hypothetical protein SK128_023213 [Halocaridina rubra]|uniref:BRICHOS domain-containing protein n=1 Tax=Halocaridina rubra TaxID=373956 RepID=A0AAN8WTI2_HALRR